MRDNISKRQYTEMEAYVHQLGKEGRLCITIFEFQSGKGGDVAVGRYGNIQQISYIPQTKHSPFQLTLLCTFSSEVNTGIFQLEIMYAISGGLVINMSVYMLSNGVRIMH